jgi:transcriptional regulator with XRE-family HTH domain
MRINVGARIRAERKARNLSQADLERRTGFPRCRISYLEHGRAVPTIETLEKISDALEIPLYQLFYIEDGGASAGAVPEGIQRNSGVSSGSASAQSELGSALSRLNGKDRQTLLYLARRMLGSTAKSKTHKRTNGDLGRQATPRT